MLILHTSDWHIGRRFERESLEADQRAFLGWLAEEVQAREIDLVIVAGDIYDRSLPAEEAVTLLDEGLELLRAAGAEVALISGNHDSARRLGFGARRQARGGVHVFTDDLSDPEPFVFTASDGESVAILAVPFLDPSTVRRPADAPDGAHRSRTHQHVLEDALAAGRRALAELPPLPAIAVAHAFVAGSATSESEKTLAIGGSDQVDADVFAGFSYVALGHLHRPQIVRAEDGVLAYSGSPLPYSFSETGPKSVRLLEIVGGELIVHDPVAVPVGRPVVTLTDTLENLCTDGRYQEYVDHWVAAELTDTSVQVGAMDQLRQRFPHAVRVRYSERSGGPLELVDSERIERRTPEENVLDFLAQLLDRPPADGERTLVHAAIEATVRGGGDR